jgi:hypothetical protein
MGRDDCKQLFSRGPAAVWEHPPGLSTEADRIVPGRVEGYEAYGPNWDGNPAAVVGPFDPVVREYVGWWGTRMLYIEDNYRVHGEDRYWFRPSYGEGEGEGSRACWFQGGCTSRFIRKP